MQMREANKNIRNGGELQIIVVEVGRVQRDWSQWLLKIHTHLIKSIQW
jgi:hypothetical protein